MIDWYLIVVKYDMKLYDMIRYDMTWYDMIWYSILSKGLIDWYLIQVRYDMIRNMIAGFDVWHKSAIPLRYTLPYYRIRNLLNDRILQKRIQYGVT